MAGHRNGSVPSNGHGPESATPVPVPSTSLVLSAAYHERLASGEIRRFEEWTPSPPVSPYATDSKECFVFEADL